MIQRIYFMKPVGHLGPIKIGCSRWPENRLNDISHWSPIPLEIVAAAPGNFKLERYLHDLFAAARSHKEWFNPTDELVEGIAEVAAGASIEAAFGVAVVRYRKSRWNMDAHRLAVYGPAPVERAA